MTPDDDDDSLSWAGDRDPTHVDSVVAPRAGRKGSADSDPAAEEAGGNEQSDVLPPAAAGGAYLVAIGILVGIYLLYTIGWIVTVQHTGTLATTQLEQIALVAKEWLAVAACALWFAAAILLTRSSRPVTRLVWLAAGALVLIPWPFVFGIANG